MKVAKAKGRLRGKQPKLTRRQEAHLVSLLRTGKYTAGEVADLFGIGRSTVYRAIQRQRHLTGTTGTMTAGRSGAVTQHELHANN